MGLEMTKKKAAAAAPADDSDLDDLLAGGKAGDSTETAPLNLDHLTQGKMDIPRRQARFNTMSMADLLSAYCNYLCYQYPTVCVCLALSFILLIVVVLVNATLNPTEEFGVIKQDFSSIGEHGITNIRSEFDDKMGKIDHWCLYGGNDRCRCEDPLSPLSRSQYKTWVDIHKRNKKSVVAYLDSQLLDVAFLGESLVEEMDGRWLGRDESDELKAIGKIFAKRFKKQKNSDSIEGVALGIAGDTTPNVLWRILHGEMPKEFNPAVWWISLGMNDLGRSQCSEEVVVIGILRVVEEIRAKKPDALIVINSLLPMADLRGGLFPLMTDYRDAFRQGRGSKREPQVESSRYVAKANLVSDESSTEETDQQGKKVTKERKKETKEKKRKRGNAVKGSNDSSRRLTESRERALKRRKKGRGKKEQQEAKQSQPVEEQQAAQPPEMDEAELRRRKRMESRNRMRRDPYNPRLNPYQHKMKKYDAHKLFLKKNRLPLWTSIYAINEELRKFCEKHEKITYFDATDIFAERTEEGQYMLLSDRISIRGHPTVQGFEKWEDAIVAKLKKWLPKKESQPAKSSSTTQPKDKSEKLNVRKVTAPPKKDDSTENQEKNSKEVDSKDDKEDENEGRT